MGEHNFSLHLFQESGKNFRGLGGIVVLKITITVRDFGSKTFIFPSQTIRIPLKNPEMGPFCHFLQHPPIIIARIGPLDFINICLEKESFVEPEDLRRRYGDLLEALVYILFDHKSSSDPDALLQLLGYMLAIWRRELQIRREKGILVYPLPPPFAGSVPSWGTGLVPSRLLRRPGFGTGIFCSVHGAFFPPSLRPDPIPRRGASWGGHAPGSSPVTQARIEARLAPFVEVFFGKLAALIDQPNGQCMLKMLVAYLSELGTDLDPKIVGRPVREV